MIKNVKSIVSIVGGGPASLLTLKHFYTKHIPPHTIYIFERNDRFGVGMPYGKFGSLNEHVANISANELPELVYSFKEYLRKHPSQVFNDFSNSETFNQYQVIPRLLLGDYLEDQFRQYIKLLRKRGCKVIPVLNTEVVDIAPYFKNENQFLVICDTEEKIISDKIIIATGHFWPKVNEDKTKNWYDSPYPLSKFQGNTNFTVAIRGTSLTAVDAVKTIARLNGCFLEDQKGKIIYKLNPDSKDFKIRLFSTGGFLPALRFHSEEDPYSSDWTMSLEEIYNYKKENGGFVDLDHVFEINFKRPIQQIDPHFYSSIKDMSLEEFANKMLNKRSERDSFELFKTEYLEAEKSIRNRKSITWKEKLAAFSYAMNYPAKHFSAEDMLRLKKVLMPLISVIIASLPQSSYKEVMALYDAGLIDLVQVNKESSVDPHPISGGIYKYINEQGKDIEEHYLMFIDAIGQQQMNINDFMFDGLKDHNIISSGYLNFKNYDKGKALYEKGTENVIKGHNNNFYLRVPGLGINDFFQSLNIYSEAIGNLYIMAVPFIGGLNPDYSGLDFCDTASEKIVEAIHHSYELLEEDENFV